MWLADTERYRLVFAIVYGLSFLKEKLTKPAAERAQYEQLRDSDDAH